MRVLTLAASLLCSAIVSAQTTVPEAIMIPEAYATVGTAAVNPDKGISGEHGTWTVTYTVGESGIVQGGGIRVELPDEWHSGPKNSGNRLQTKDPKLDNYITANTTASGVTVQCIVEDERDETLIKHPKKSLDGRTERFVFVVRVIVTGGALKAGDAINVVYGDTSGGSKGYWGASVSALPLPILIALDPDGDNRFELHASDLTLEALPGKPVYAQIHAPSNAQAGTPFLCRIAMLDKEFNPATGPATFTLTYPEGVTGPESLSIYRDHAWNEFEVTANTTGIVRINGVWAEEKRELLGNPTEVTETLPERALYWGDLHSHTRYSWDGVGRDGFTYARFVSSLDFYAMTDHAMSLEDGLMRGLNNANWEEYNNQTRAYYVPGSFVTLHAYECSFGPPWGHHNVYFRDEPGPLVFPKESSLPELWEALDKGNALTIPHHTGKFPRGVEFSVDNPDLRRNFEMYSGHGLSEAFDPAHPLAFEQSDFTVESKSAEGAVNLQDALRLGLQVSVIGSSDDHRAHPGIAMYGLAAVRATSLDRDAIFQGLYDRNTYATTGAKIILDFDVNGTPMGQQAPHQENANVHIKAHGTDVIEWVEVLRWLPGEATFTVVQRWEPKSLDFEATWEDAPSTPGAIYYTRLRQQKLVHKRIAMAWSSPVWVAK